jgi:hypothetical protein
LQDPAQPLPGHEFDEEEKEGVREMEEDISAGRFDIS